MEVLSEEIFKFFFGESGLKGLEEIFFHYGHLAIDSSKKFGCEQKKIASRVFEAKILFKIGFEG